MSVAVFPVLLVIGVYFSEIISNGKVFCFIWFYFYILVVNGMAIFWVLPSQVKSKYLYSLEVI